MFRPIMVLLLTLTLAGCPLEGDDGNRGVAGIAGINCWDSNGDRINDQLEDVNFDGNWNAADCVAANTVAQSKEAEFNHQHICEALANLGQYPAGCPSNGYVAPTGTLTMLYVDSDSKFFDDGSGGYDSCNAAPNNGPLSIAYRADTKNAWFELEGGYVVSRTVMALSDETSPNHACYAKCNGDTKCFAALAKRLNGTEAHECLIFYHSDTVSKYEYLCGVDYSGVGSASNLCKDYLGVYNRWSVKCP